MKRLLLLATLPLLAQTPEQNLDRLRAAFAQPSPELAQLRQLCDGIGGRVTGSPAFARALHWGMDGFKAAGVPARVEPFTLANGWTAAPPRIRVLGPMGFAPLATSWGWSPPCAGTFRILDGGDGSDTALKALGSRAKGAFIYLASEPMTTPEALFGEYATTSRQSAITKVLGAKGLIVQSTRPRKLLYRHLDPRCDDGRVADQVEIQIAREDGARLGRLLKDGSVSADIRMPNRVSGPVQAGNVIAEIPGSDLKDEVVLIGAHLDSWELGTGALDNGCNAAMVVGIARLFKAANLHPRRTVRFALFGGEEEGMLGSRAYVKAHRAELDRIRAVVIYDEGLGKVSGFSMGATRMAAHPGRRAVARRRRRPQGPHRGRLRGHGQLRLPRGRRSHPHRQSGLDGLPAQLPRGERHLRQGGRRRAQTPDGSGRPPHVGPRQRAHAPGSSVPRTGGVAPQIHRHGAADEDLRDVGRLDRPQPRAEIAGEKSSPPRHQDKKIRTVMNADECPSACISVHHS